MSTHLLFNREPRDLQEAERMHLDALAKVEPETKRRACIQAFFTKAMAAIPAMKNGKRGKSRRPPPESKSGGDRKVVEDALK